MVTSSLKFERLQSREISKNLNIGGFRCNEVKRVWAGCSYTHTFKDGDVTIQSNYDII